jgi:cytoskeleton protein RodZ
MNDDAPLRASAGAMLRAARERQGLHIAALAAAIKVTPRKLDALEHDRYDELPDIAFTRALAQTICRTLKIDAAPVLALLPHADPAALDHVGGSLNTPFRERPSRDDPGGLATAAIRPMVWAGAALMVAALVLYLLPNGLWPAAPANPPLATTVPVAPLPAPGASEPAAAEAINGAEPAATIVTTPVVPFAAAASAAPAPAAVASVPAAAAPVVAQSPTAAPASAPASASLLQLRADQASWIEARDARGQVLVSRVVQPGESVGVDGAMPIKLTIGNARATQVSLRGQPVDLGAATRDNVARLEVQ